MGEEIKGVGVTQYPSDEEAEKDNKLAEHDAMIHMFKKVALFENALRTLFGNSAHIITKKIFGGGTSAQIFLPKRFKKKSATIIVWDDDRFKE